MNVIWKYELKITDDQDIEMPEGAKPLSVGVQRSIPVMWAEVDPDIAPKNLHVKIFGTGHFIPSGLHFVGTFQIGGFVGHVYTVQS